MTTTAADRPFDICGPLPSGVTVLEASAGTGKTYTVAALAARYVAEGVPLEQLLLVTFTRMATGELRDRVRERLVSAEQELARILAAVPDPGVDEVVTVLASGPRGQVELRRERLARGVSNFDAATIATTHGFCQAMLAELGTVGDLDPATTFVEDVGDVLEEVLDDLYIRRFHSHGGPRFNRSQGLSIARAAVFNPTAALEPRGERYETTAAMRYRLAQAVRVELEVRKRRMAIMTHDDLLTRLNATLSGDRAAAARARLRARYRVVLVDEFQDTDPVQWQILRRAFAAEGIALVLIADPKQAIYAFRGADVYAYLVAASTAAQRATLRINYRSDQGLIDAYDALFANARLGDQGIVYRKVKATAANQTPRLLGAPVAASLRIRVVHRDEPTTKQTPTGLASAPASRAHIARDLAADIVALLSSEARIEQRTPAGEPKGSETVCPGHIAVLVRTHRTAELVRGALDAARVPAVVNGAGSVFATASARDWVRLLEAIERPAYSPRARTAALTPFLGWSAERIATAHDSEWEEVHQRLHRWARILRDGGVAALTETITLREGLSARVLAFSDGERRLTDLHHVSQLLHRAATTERLGATALTGWLRERIASTEREEGDEERTRRLESDAEAVQVLTIHRSKGLEFPIVYCPFLWEPSYIPRDPEPVFFHDPENGNKRTVDVGLDSPDFDSHARQHRFEQRGEDLRLAYVALTRAQHQAVIWWAGSWDSRHSPLSRLLFAIDGDGNVAADGSSVPSDVAAVSRFEQLAAQATGRISVERSTLAMPNAWSPPLKASVKLESAQFDRHLDLRWRRTSYSDITAGTHDPQVTSEPEESVVTDEPEGETPIVGAPDVPDDPALMTPSLLGEMPVGLQVGTLVHRVLEATDFAAADLDTELREHITATRGRLGVDIGDTAAVATGLRAAVETPLGPALDDISLREVERTDRLDELEFELPLAGGDKPTGWLTLSAIRGLLREHLAAGDPLAGYANRLEDQALRQRVRGYLTGSLDLVIRIAGDDAPRFAVLDYKTNWLAGPDEQLTAWHHRPTALAAEMEYRHYGLQALLYTVALHRYLRWRVRDYDPERHLAGVLYLFLRGMTGPDTPTIGGVPCGVFAWKPPKALVQALSDALDVGA